MSDGPARLVARHVHDLVERQRLDALPDPALLRRFLDGDEVAFAALVRRHGPLVLGTCRRILRHAHDAEDACQAVFLVLARKARTVRGGSLAAWLHRVAVRAASRLRRARRVAEPLPLEVHAPEPAGDELVWREIRQTFDHEVGRLPDRFRLPLVLCCLQGKTRSEAAAELGWSEGAVRGRLERGRKLLRSRFTRRGLALSATLLPLLVEQVAPATAPPTVVSPSSVAAKLADGLVRSMALARAKVAAWAAAAVLVAGTTIGVGVQRPVTAQPKPDDAASPPTSVPAVAAADAQRNLDTFVLRISLAPAGEGKVDPKFSLYHVLLYVPNLRLEPPAHGSDGKPTEAHARISKEQAQKIVDALASFDFFKDDSAFNDPWTAKPQLMNQKTWPHVDLTVRFQNGEDAARRSRMLAWLPSMLPPLDAIRGCVDGEAAKALDLLLGQLAEDRRKWAPDSLAEDLKKLQGSWVAELPGDRLRVEVKSTRLAKCVVDGKNITLKPEVQRDPLLDLETIRGTFELSAGPPHTMTIKGIRDTVSKQEAGTWTVTYEVTDGALKLLLPPANAAPAGDRRAATGKGERLFAFTRQAGGPVSEWGEPSGKVQTRLRASKAKYAAGEVPSFDLDVRDTHAGVAGKPWHWMAPRLGELARVEVDGVWYRSPPKDYWKLVTHELGLGQTVEKWVTVTLTAGDWLAEGKNDKPHVLVFRPGKHTVRVGYQFNASGAAMPGASPISGPVAIEVLPTAAASPTSDWGEASNGVQSRIHASRATYPAGETPSFDLDVRDTHDGAVTRPWRWQAPRLGQFARVEVDGVWYRDAENPVKKYAADPLGFGQTVEKWTTVALTADVWATAATSEMPSRKLVLRPGRHKVRVAFEFNPSGGGVVPASPVSGPVEIEILPAKSVGHASDWGEPSKGVSSRIRTTKPKFAFGEGVTLELDVKAAGDGGRELAVWTAARNSSPSRVEFDGVWYKRVPDEVARVLAPKLTAGEQVDGWATLNLSDQWVVEYYTGIPPEQVSERLTLSPGKHKLRVGFSFSNPTASAVPVSGPLEIEVLPVTGTATPPPGAGWRSKTVWIPHGAAGLKHLAVVADEKHLFTAGKDGVILWDVSGPEPKAEQKVAFTISGLSMAGLDRDGNPLLVRRVDRPQTRGSLTDLTVLRLPDVGERLPPTVTVDSDNLRQFAVSADGRTLAVMLGGWGGVKLIDVASRNEQTLDAPKVAGKYEPYPHALFFSRDGKTLIGLGSSDYPVHGEVNGRVVCWDTETGKVRWQADELAGHPIGALSPDGRTLVTGGSLVSPEVVVWDMATGTRRARRETAASALAVSPDGNTVLVGAPSKDSPRRGVLQVWDLAWNEPLAQAIPVPANIQFLSIRDDGRAFATADSAGEVRWWEWKK